MESQVKPITDDDVKRLKSLVPSDDYSIFGSTTLLQENDVQNIVDILRLTAKIINRYAERLESDAKWTPSHIEKAESKEDGKS